MHGLLCAAPSMLHSSSQPSLYVAGVAALEPFRTVCIPRLFKQSRPKHCEVANGEGRLAPAPSRTHDPAHVFTCNRLVHIRSIPVGLSVSSSARGRELAAHRGDTQAARACR